VAPRIQLGPPRIALAEGSSLFVTSPEGEVEAIEQHGFFVSDTRLLSTYRLHLAHRPWLLVSSAPLGHYAAEFIFVNPDFEAPEGRVRRGTLGFRLQRTLRGGVHDDLEVTNYGLRPVTFPLVIEADCDFADLFEIRGLEMPRRRTIQVRSAAGEIRWLYQRAHYRRGLILRVARSDVPPDVATPRIIFELTLPPRTPWRACLHFIPLLGDRVLEAPEDCGGALLDELEERRRQWYGAFAACETPHADLAQTYRQAVEDLTVLRLTAADSAVEHCVVAAGIPWFATLFGRDSLIISLQTLPVSGQFAPAVLRELGALQATEVDDWRDAQPGKILHEVRHGELAEFQEIPHTPYYGTADATLLYVITLHETYRWLGDRDLVDHLLPVAERALTWMDKYGDLDGDGFQEYRRRSPRGITHQGWKDSGDSVVDAQGYDVPPPVALVELQGYAYDAKRRMAELYQEVGRPEDAARLRQEASVLRARFRQAFWWPEEGTYYFALDGSKRPVRSVVSNAGHALWSGIATAEEARGVAARLMADDMFSGWGVRTLSSDHPAFNPFGYQVGAVWPHDNSLIALGFKRYGFVGEALRVAEGILEAAAHFHSYRLPELFAGLQRGPRSFPVQYLEANVPQGWAAGSVFALLRMMLGLRADAPRGRLLVHPTLPEWLPRLRLKGLTVGRAVVDLEAFREGERTRWEATVRAGRLEVIEQPWSPEEV